MSSIRELDGVYRSNAWAVDSPERIQVLDGFNPRTVFKKIDELAEDILENGVLTPLWVRRDRANPEQPFILIAGERRMRALHKIFEKNPEMEMRIPVIVHDVDEEEAKDMAAMENLKREDFTLSDKVALVRDYQKRGFSNADIAKKLEMSPGWVDQMATMAGASKAVKNAVDEGRLTLEAGLILARKAKAADQNAKLEEVLRMSGGQRRKTAKAASQVTGAVRRPGKRDIVKVVKSLAQTDVNGDSVPTQDARKLVIMALNFAAGEADGEALVKACRKQLKLKAKKEESK
jgi:ParB/RepB/Spo0J family partition protein